MMIKSGRRKPKVKLEEIWGQNSRAGRSAQLIREPANQVAEMTLRSGRRLTESTGCCAV